MNCDKTNGRQQCDGKRPPNKSGSNLKHQRYMRSRGRNILQLNEINDSWIDVAGKGFNTTGAMHMLDSNF